MQSQPGIGILTERDILDSVGAGQDPDTEMVADHRTSDVVFASPDWTLEQAASAMTKGNFRHLIVVEDNDVAGLLSMRDIVRCWSRARRRGGCGLRLTSPTRVRHQGRARGARRTRRGGPGALAALFRPGGSGSRRSA